MTNFLVGTSSIGMVEGVQHIPSVTPTVDIIKLAIQLVIGIVALVKMFKKPKSEETPK